MESVLPWASAVGSERWALKLHGDVEHPDSIVLTRRHMLTYDAQNRPSAALLQSVLLTKHLLVIGTSLTDDNVLRLAYEVQAYRVHHRPKSEETFGTQLDASAGRRPTPRSPVGGPTRLGLPGRLGGGGSPAGPGTRSRSRGHVLDQEMRRGCLTNASPGCSPTRQTASWPVRPGNLSKLLAGGTKEPGAHWSTASTSLVRRTSTHVPLTGPDTAATSEDPCLGGHSVLVGSGPTCDAIGLALNASNVSDLMGCRAVERAAAVLPADPSVLSRAGRPGRVVLPGCAGSGSRRLPSEVGAGRPSAG